MPSVLWGAQQPAGEAVEPSETRGFLPSLRTDLSTVPTPNKDYSIGSGLAFTLRNPKQEHECCIYGVLYTDVVLLFSAAKNLKLSL